MKEENFHINAFIWGSAFKFDFSDKSMYKYIFTSMNSDLEKIVAAINEDIDWIECKSEVPSLYFGIHKYSETYIMADYVKLMLLGQRDEVKYFSELIFPSDKVYLPKIKSQKDYVDNPMWAHLCFDFDVYSTRFLTKLVGIQGFNLFNRIKFWLGKTAKPKKDFSHSEDPREAALDPYFAYINNCYLVSITDEHSEIDLFGQFENVETLIKKIDKHVFRYGTDIHITRHIRPNYNEATVTPSPPSPYSPGLNDFT